MDEKTKEIVERLREIARDLAAVDSESINAAADLITRLSERVEELERSCKEAADLLEAHYLDLPKDQYPGPPTNIVEGLRALLSKQEERG